MKIFWLEILNNKYSNFFEDIKKLDKRLIISTPNPEMLLKASKDNDFYEILKKSDFLVPDGIWLFLAFQIIDNYRWFFFEFINLPFYIFNLIFRKKNLYKKYWERICWSDLTLDLLKFSETNNKKVVIIDLYNPKDKQKIVSQKLFEGKLQKIFYNLDFEYFIYKQEEKENIIENIKKSQSEILFSTLGMKLQEESILEIMSKCENIKLWIWVWSSLDVLTWFQKKTPYIIKKIGFEWFYRLLKWPRKFNRLLRLWNAIFVFPYKVMKIEQKKYLKK